MSQFPAFNVRDYPSFRPARLYRVVFSDQGIYFLRMRGLIGHSEAGADHFMNGTQAAISNMFRLWASQSIASSVEAIDEANPADLVKASKKNFVILPDDFTSSVLEPPVVFGGHGNHFARWKFTLMDGRKATYQLETVEDLKIALVQLPVTLGATQQIKVGWDEQVGHVIKL